MGCLGGKRAKKEDPKFLTTWQVAGETISNYLMRCEQARQGRRGSEQKTGCGLDGWQEACTGGSAASPPVESSPPRQLA